ncbi:secretin N-terminal domain-containing protein [Pseudoalteromonas denitrificans]|uniref:General secretion pathway protein D n=1 Tax=Pseudoalteromonas denitrificans DSM 6059 TaxID=1123010 RepID=A0A1I1JUP2_9GAMM|nr:secretin N-terminal domain-containing protein [Pseudoalteromonas denitrificans]SFC52294.1 general secretion pathway protein D [Pseudoalteromonas denitrificans DSM 6059]
MNNLKNTMQMKNIKHITFSFLVTLSLNACVTAPNAKYSPKKSYLKQDSISLAASTGANLDDKKLSELKVDLKKDDVTYLPSLTSEKIQKKAVVDLTEQFSEFNTVKITADDLPLKDYLHYVLGDLLKISYILGEQVKTDSQSVTLNLQQNISQRKLFSLSEQLLVERGYVIRFDDGIFYIHKEEGKASGAFAYGYGNKIESVPKTSATILQLVPFNFGMQTSLANTLTQILKIRAQADFQRSTLILQGKRKDIIRALEFINLMDQPIFKNRHIGAYKTTYVSTDDLMKQLPILLKQEGVSVSAAGQNDLAVSLVALDRIGTLILFANSEQLIDRVFFWAKQIDQAPSGNELQYFLYAPQFSRATDLGESLQLLIGGGSSTVSSNTSASSQNKQITSKTNKPSNGMSASNEDMNLVVDERANALIFHTTGDKYRQLLPLIKRLDVMPKQVLLEVMIAEVKLSDVFKQGVSFALTNQGSINKVGGFKFESGAKGLSYVLSGGQGNLTFSLLETNSNVNVLSRPSLLVRDGVKATIIVGDDIPTVGEIITDPTNGSQTSVIYRKTGVELQVKPTINAQGIVIMEIAQKISNQVKGDSSVAGSPIIFERSISTEVIAQSGQTIILGGLISENRTINDTSVPFFSSIPIVGKLFDSTEDTDDKTELVVLVTPKVIESVEEWENIKLKFSSAFKKLKID